MRFTALYYDYSNSRRRERVIARNLPKEQGKNPRSKSNFNYINTIAVHPINLRAPCLAAKSFIRAREIIKALPSPFSSPLRYRPRPFQCSLEGAPLQVRRRKRLVLSGRLTFDVYTRSGRIRVKSRILVEVSGFFVRPLSPVGTRGEWR